MLFLLENVAEWETSSTGASDLRPLRVEQNFFDLNFDQVSVEEVRFEAS